MPKPLKSKHLNKHKRLKDQILSRQGVGDGKRKRLGHSSHFAKLEQIPIVRQNKHTISEVNAPLPAKKKRTKFNKFRTDGADGLEDGEGGGEEEEEQVPATKKPAKEKLDARLPGESFTKFMKRLNKETQQMLVVQASKATHVVEKRKNFLNERKKQRKEKMQNKKKGLHKIKEDSEEDEDAEQPSEEKVRAAVQAAPKFGEQAIRPPIIRMLKPLKGLFKMPTPDSSSSGGGYIIGGMPAIPELSGESIKKAQFEALRKSAISSYRKQVAIKRESKGMLTLNTPIGKKGHY